MRILVLLTLLITLGGGLWVSGHVWRSHPPDTPPISANRPSNEWWMWYIDDKTGDRKYVIVEVTTLDNALRIFRKRMGPDVLVVCASSAYYYTCNDRILPW